MKTLRVLGIFAATAGMLLTATQARAEVAGAKLHGFMVYKTDDACAAAIEVTKSNGGLTDGTEVLKLGLKYAISFAVGGFTPKSGAFGVGARVLFGSPAFATQTGAKVDATIPDATCKDFVATGGELSFDGSLSQNPGLIKPAIPANFGTWRALDGTGKSVDLSKDSFKYGGFTGEWTIGGSGASSSSGSSGSSSSSGTTSSSSGGSDAGGSSSSSSGATPALDPEKGACDCRATPGGTGNSREQAMAALAAVAVFVVRRGRRRQ